MATIEQRIYDGDQARLVLENEAFAAAFADIRREYTEAWAQSPARDAEGREKLYLMIKLSEKLELTLRSAMEDGKLAKIQVEYERDRITRERADGINVSGWHN